MIMIMIIATIHIIKMETIFMNTENCKTNESHRFKLDLAMTSICLLKKDQDEEFLTLLKDMLKQIINT